MGHIHPLKAYRENHEPRLTQKQLAELLDEPKATVSRWETGERKVAVAKLHKVAERTGIPAAALRPDLADLLKQSEDAE